MPSWPEIVCARLLDNDAKCSTPTPPARLLAPSALAPARDGGRSSMCTTVTASSDAVPDSGDRKRRRRFPPGLFLKCSSSSFFATCPTAQARNRPRCSGSAFSASPPWYLANLVQFTQYGFGALFCGAAAARLAPGKETWGVQQYRHRTRRAPSTKRHQMPCPHASESDARNPWPHSSSRNLFPQVPQKTRYQSSHPWTDATSPRRLGHS